MSSARKKPKCHLLSPPRKQSMLLSSCQFGPLQRGHNLCRGDLRTWSWSMGQLNAFPEADLFLLEDKS